MNGADITERIMDGPAVLVLTAKTRDQIERNGPPENAVTASSGLEGALANAESLREQLREQVKINAALQKTIYLLEAAFTQASAKAEFLGATDPRSVPGLGGTMLTYSVSGPDKSGEFSVVYVTAGQVIPTVTCVYRTRQTANTEADRRNACQVAGEEAERHLRSTNRSASGFP